MTPESTNNQDLVNEPPNFKVFSSPDRLLMGAGPSQVHADVLSVMSNRTIGHLDPKMLIMMDELKDMLRYVFQTQNEMTFPVSGPGSLGMEACVNNLVEPGDKVLISINGVFGSRMAEVARRTGATVVTTEDEWGDPVDLDKVKAAFVEHPDIKVIGFVHAETSTGVLSDAAGLCQIATQYGALTIMDTVTSLAGVPVHVDVWGADAVYSGSQKCLSCPPGLSPVTFSDRAVGLVEKRKIPVQSWLLDLSLLSAYWQGEGTRTYHHTAPVNSLMGLHESLRRVVNEGLESVWKRHRDCQKKMVSGLNDLGFKMLVKEEYRLPELITAFLPEDIDDAQGRRKLLEEFDIEVSAGLGPFAGKLWRVGLMGETARLENVERLLDALQKIGR